jgi:hypothetical protein
MNTKMEPPMHIKKFILSATMGIALTIVAASSPSDAEPFSQQRNDVRPQAVGQSGWAVVNPNGTLARNKNVMFSNKINKGIYYVNFNSNIRQCAYVATSGLSGHNSQPKPAYVTVVGLEGATDGVEVQTYNSAGVQTDEGFHLLVTC